jgi:hypothetical protein
VWYFGPFRAPSPKILAAAAISGLLIIGAFAVSETLGSILLVLAVLAILFIAAPRRLDDLRNPPDDSR